MAVEKPKLSVNPEATAKDKGCAATDGESPASRGGDGNAPRPTPVARLTGIARKGRADESDYLRHLEEKYL